MQSVPRRICAQAEGFWSKLRRCGTNRVKKTNSWLFILPAQRICTQICDRLTELHRSAPAAPQRYALRVRKWRGWHRPDGAMRDALANGVFIPDVGAETLRLVVSCRKRSRSKTVLKMDALCNSERQVLYRNRFCRRSPKPIAKFHQQPDIHPDLREYLSGLCAS
jgi:hypothetical protein